MMLSNIAKNDTKNGIRKYLEAWKEGRIKRRDHQERGERGTGTELVCI